jgi:putative transposase
VFFKRSKTAHINLERRKQMQIAQLPPDGPSDEGLFRYQVLSQVLARENNGEPRSKAVKAVAATDQLTAAKKVRKVSRRSIYRWLSAFESRGFIGLVPVQRTSKHDSVVLPQSLIDFFKDQKTQDPLASVPELIRRATICGQITPDQIISRVTVWRTLNRMGIDTSRSKKVVDRDSRRFAYPHRMQMALCDGKHFRAGLARLHRVALFFLDDSSRMGLHAVVGTSETTQLFLRGLYETILSYGMMDALFVDRGPGFIANDTIEVLRKLGILFIHGSAGYPEGHGKIERFNRTAKDQALRHLDGHPEVDPSCAALELRLNHYLREQYNLAPHESLGKHAPWACFHEDKKPLRFAESQDRVRQCFILNTTRRVSNDNVVSLDGVSYQVIRGHAGARVMVHRNVLDGSVAIVHQGRFVRLEVLDVHKNATDKRARNPLQDKKDPHRRLTRGSAQMAFDQQMRPVVDPDGGFARPEKPSKNNLKED